MTKKKKLNWHTWNATGKPLHVRICVTNSCDICVNLSFIRRCRNLSLWWSCEVFLAPIIDFFLSFLLEHLLKSMSIINEKRARLQRHHKFEGISKTRRIPINARRTRRKAIYSPDILCNINKFIHQIGFNTGPNWTLSIIIDCIVCKQSPLFMHIALKDSYIIIFIF